MQKSTLGCLAIFALVAGGIASIPLLLPPKFEYRESIVVRAAPEQIYPLIVRPRNWAQWTYWHDSDRKMVNSYPGKQKGVGARWTWRSQMHGQGKMLITKADPAQGIEWQISVTGSGESTGAIELEAQGEQTKVTWRVVNDAKTYQARWLALLTPRELNPIVGLNLANLKRAAEKPAPERTQPSR